jgi:A/G-specific adenine glycosylase
VLLRRRPPRGLLGGMAEVPGSAWKTGLDHAAAVAFAPIAGLAWREAPTSAEHVFTHFALTVTVLAARVAPGASAPEGCWWQPLARLEEAGLPTVMRKIVAAGISG